MTLARSPTLRVARRCLLNSFPWLLSCCMLHGMCANLLAQHLHAMVLNDTVASRYLIFLCIYESNEQMMWAWRNHEAGGMDPGGADGGQRGRAARCFNS